MARLRSPEHRVISQRVQAAFGKRLRAQRKGRRSQDVLAEDLDVSRTSVSNIERGRHRVFLDQAYLAARALGVTLNDLLPTLDEVFAPVPVAFEENSGVVESSVRRASEIASNIQQRATMDKRVKRSRQRARK